MGRAGIRRRKPAHHLPKLADDDITPDDARRLFGEFRWNQYSPAGSLERSGFFLRQLARRDRHPEWQRDHAIVGIGSILLFLVYGSLGVVAGIAVVVWTINALA